MSARVFKPISLAARTTSNDCNSSKRAATSPTPPSHAEVARVRRVLFEPIDHEETQRFLERELATQARKESDKWQFDFVNERPLNGARFEWTLLSENVLIEKQQQLQIKDDDNDENEDTRKKQTLITDFMQSRKRSDAPSKKILKNNSTIPKKIAKTS